VIAALHVLSFIPLVSGAFCLTPLAAVVANLQ
jgi:hypothetical protein